MILAVINNKGGAVKMTSAVNLAAVLAMKGRRPLHPRQLVLDKGKDLNEYYYLIQGGKKE